MSWDDYRERKAAKMPVLSTDPPPLVRDAIRAMHEELSGRIKILRGKRIQRMWGHHLGVWQQNLNRYENGTIPHPDFLVHLYVQENVNIEWLLTGNGKPYREGGPPRATHESSGRTKTGRLIRKTKVNIDDYVGITKKPPPLEAPSGPAKRADPDRAINIDQYVPKQRS